MADGTHNGTHLSGPSHTKERRAPTRPKAHFTLYPDENYSVHAIALGKRLNVLLLGAGSLYNARPTSLPRA